MTESNGDASAPGVEGGVGTDGRSPHWSTPTKRMVAVGLVAFIVFVIWLARGAITLVVLSAVLAFLIAPLVRIMRTRFRLPKPIALVVAYFLLLLALLLIGVVVANGVIGSISEIDPPTAVESLRSNALSLLERFERIEMFGYVFDLSEVVEPLEQRLETPDREPAAATEEANAGITTITLGRDSFFSLAGTALGSLRTVGGLVLAAVLSAVVVFLVALYMNLDSHKFHRTIADYVPAEYVDEIGRLGDRITGIWHGYVYGQLINSAATGLLVWVALALLGLRGAFVLGVLMALLNMIPTFGPIIAAVPGILSAFALGSSRFDLSNIAFALLVGVVYLVVVQVQANVMAPFITGRSVQMSPAAILVGLLVGVQVAGLIGAVLVVPVMATGKTVIKYVVAKLLDRPPFDDDAGQIGTAGAPGQIGTPDPAADPALRG